MSYHLHLCITPTFRGTVSLAIGIGRSLTIGRSLAVGRSLAIGESSARPRTESGALSNTRDMHVQSGLYYVTIPEL